MKHRYEANGLHAVDPRAFFFLFEEPSRPDVEMRNGVALVTVRGPLEHHARRWWGDSYEAITTRVGEAIASEPKAIVLVIDSPGGAVSGCFDAARQLRSMTRAAGVPLYSFVEGQACSAAYALACAADRIFASQTALIGSIGVIDALVDARKQAEQRGLEFAIVSSGARKSDGNPHAGISEEAVAASQKRVDDLAASFFGLVSEMRGIDAAKVQALDAGIVLGAEAKDLGLADEVTTFEDVLALASGEKETGMPQASKDMDDAVAKLRKAAEGDDDEAKRAKRMLAAMDEDEGDDDKSKKSKAEGDDEDKKDESKSKSKAEGDDDQDDAPKKAKAEDDEEDAKALASTDLKLAARIQELEAQSAARAEADRKAAEDAEREELLASRPDFAQEALDVLRAAPLATVKEAVEKWPRGRVRIPNNPLSATAQPGATRGAGQGGGSSDHLPPEEAAELDRKMGLRRDANAIKHTGTTMSLGVMTKAEARAFAKRRAAAATPTRTDAQ